MGELILPRAISHSLTNFQVPATINRVWGLKFAKSNPNLAMNLMAAFVLPLQGFFNCLIYLFFSRQELRKEYHRTVTRLRNTKWIRKARNADDEDSNVMEKGSISPTTSLNRSREVITAQDARDLDERFDSPNEDDDEKEIDLREMLGRKITRNI